MADDDIHLPNTSFGPILAADDVGGIKYPRAKVGWGRENEYEDVNPENPLPVGFFDLPNLFQFGDEVGDESGNINANGDYSSAPRDFAIAPGPDQIFAVARLIVTIRDSGSFDSGFYGNNIVLTNGIQVEVRQGIPNGSSVLETSLTGPVTVKTNTDWASYCYDVAVSNFGQGDEVMAVRWTFTRGGGYIVLRGSDQDFLTIRLNDNFTGLVYQAFNFQGLWVNF